jgi:hypothetical protein
MRPSGLPELSNIIAKSATADLDGADPESGSGVRLPDPGSRAKSARPGMTKK